MGTGGVASRPSPVGRRPSPSPVARAGAPAGNPRMRERWKLGSLLYFSWPIDLFLVTFVHLAPVDVYIKGYFKAVIIFELASKELVFKVLISKY